FSPADQGNDDNVDSDVNPATGITAAIQVLGGSNIDHVFAGIMDVEAPKLSGVPADVNLNCNDPAIDSPPVVTATDNCDDQVPVIFEEEILSNGGNCMGTITIIRKWTATDNCGNE